MVPAMLKDPAPSMEEVQAQNPSHLTCSSFLEVCPDGNVRDVCQLWLSYLLWGRSVEIFLEEWIYEAFHSEFHQLHQLACSMFNKVVKHPLESHLSN